MVMGWCVILNAVKKNSIGWSVQQVFLKTIFEDFLWRCFLYICRFQVYILCNGGQTLGRKNT